MIWKQVRVTICMGGLPPLDSAYPDGNTQFESHPDFLLRLPDRHCIFDFDKRILAEWAAWVVGFSGVPGMMIWGLSELDHMATRVPEKLSGKNQYKTRGLMPSAATTSLSLMARISDSRDDAATWAEFVEVYGIHVVRWCKSYGLGDADAHDLSQEVLIRFWNQSKKFQYDPTKRFRAYLRRITEATWSDWQSGLAIGVEGEGGSAMLKVLQDLPAREDLIACLEEVYDAELFERAMHDVKLRVEPTTWEAFELLSLNGLTGHEVANQLGITVRAAYLARYRVTDLLRETIVRIEQELTQP